MPVPLDARGRCSVQANHNARDPFAGHKGIGAGGFCRYGAGFERDIGRSAPLAPTPL